jgi:phosphoglycerate kinase
MSIKSIRNCENLKNKTVLVRCDFDVPLKNSKVQDGTRLKACIPTIKFLLKNKVAKIILIGHLGRPEGIDKKLSLKPIAKHLEKLLKYKINFISNSKIETLDSKIIMLENLRFSPLEQKNNKAFAKSLAKLADIYVNEAFAVSHRSASSISAIQDYLPSCAGLNLANEIQNLNSVLQKPKKPLVVIIGGAKIETKLPVIKQFLKTADYILIGGGVANTFLKVKGIDVKKSLVDEKYFGEAEKILKKIEIRNQKLGNVKLILPIDVVWSDDKVRSLSAGAYNGSLRSAGGKTPKILDIGPEK